MCRPLGGAAADNFLAFKKFSFFFCQITDLSFQLSYVLFPNSFFVAHLIFMFLRMYALGMYVICNKLPCF